MATGGHRDLRPRSERNIVQKALHIGSLFTTSVLMALLGLYTLRHPALHSIREHRLRSGILAESIAAVTFAAAFFVAVAFPGIGYWSMALLALVGPLHAPLRRFVLLERATQDGACALLDGFRPS